MKTTATILALLLSSISIFGDLIPAIYDTVTKRLAVPTNILGMTFGGLNFTNLVGYGLTNKSGVLMVDTNVIIGGSSGGSGGSNFITSVSADFEVLASALSLTNTTGSGQILRASMLSPYLLSSTAAVTYQLSTATLTRLGDIGLGTLGDWMYRDANGWTNASSASVETTLESILDLQDLQGAVTDAQVPNTITVDQATLALTGDSATGFFTTGAIEDARIDSAIARDSEIAASYQPLDPDLTAMAAGTAVSTPQTNAVSVGAPVLYVGTTNVAEAIAGISGGSGDVSSTGNNTLSGTNTFTGPTWIKPYRKKAVLFNKEWLGLNSLSIGYPEFNGTAVASGTGTIITGETNHPGMIRLSSSSSANSGYYFLSSISGLFAEPLLTWESVSRVRATNAGISKTFGFTDSANTANPTDAIRMWRSNNFLIPQIWNNGSLVQGYEYPVSSNQFVYIKFQVQTNMTDVSFYAEDSDTKTLILSTNLTGTLPASANRVFGAGHFGFFTNAVAVGIEDLEWSTAYIDTPVNR